MCPYQHPPTTASSHVRKLKYCPTSSPFISHAVMPPRHGSKAFGDAVKKSRVHDWPFGTWRGSLGKGTCLDKIQGLTLARPPSSALSHPFCGEGSPTKIDYRDKLIPLFQPLYWRTQLGYLELSHPVRQSSIPLDAASECDSFTAHTLNRRWQRTSREPADS